MHKVELYSRVHLELLGSGDEPEPLLVVLVPQADADFSRGLLGEDTPLGKAILGHQAGEVLPYRQGDLTQVRILKVEKAEDLNLLQARLEKATREGKVQANFAKQQAAIFAASSTSKWGDYDPDGVLKWEDDQDK